MVAAWRGSVSIIHILKANDAKMEIKGKRGKKALSYAVEKGHRKSVETLLYYGADVRLYTLEGDTALYVAVYGGKQVSGL
jgi:ankyrin repeat protein